MADQARTEFSINENIISEIRSQNLEVQTAENQAIISNELGSRLVTTISKAHSTFTAQEAFTAICIICQKGGTSKRVQGDINAVVNGKKLTLINIRDVMDANRARFTLRQWARTYADYIYSVNSIYGIEGDLSKKILCKHPEISNTEAIWLSNFQMDNPNYPENLRNAIKEHFNTLFPGQK